MHRNLSDKQGARGILKGVRFGGSRRIRGMGAVVNGLFRQRWAESQLKLLINERCS